MNKITLGLIGNGGMMRKEYLPYLEERLVKQDELEIGWAGGCLCSVSEIAGCPLSSSREIAGRQLGPYRRSCDSQVNDWRNLLQEQPVDGIVVSLPNNLHAAPIRAALDKGVSVAVDKPTVISAEECAELVKLAEDKKLIFVTLSQRRYEEVYKTAAEIIQRGGLGEPLFIDYLITHEFFDRGDETRRPWQSMKSMSGGGALIASGYHGIDTVLWLLSHCQPAPVRAASVSARWRLDTRDDPVETVAVARIGLNNGGIFNAIASLESPQGSLEENIKIFGTAGVIRIMRDRPEKLKGDQRAARLTYQQANGSYVEYDTRGWSGRRWAPLADFIDALHIKSQGNNPSVESPASDSLQTIRIIEKAYESAAQNGEEITL